MDNNILDKENIDETKPEPDKATDSAEAHLPQNETDNLESDIVASETDEAQHPPSDKLEEQSDDSAESDTQTAGESTDKENESNCQAETSAKCRKPIAIILSILVGIVVLLISACSAFIIVTCRTITVEVGDEPHPERIYESTFFSSLYSVDDYIIDVSKPGETSVTLRFFEYIPAKVKVKIVDTTPPTLELFDLHTLVGLKISPDDFLKSSTDATDVTLSSDTIPNEAGEYRISITATDTSGNKTVQEAKLTVWGAEYAIEGELGILDVKAEMLSLHPNIVSFNDITADFKNAGEYTVRAESEQHIYIWSVKLVDTTPPKLKTKPLAIRTGDTIPADTLVESLYDFSECSVYFGKLLDTEREKRLNTRIYAEDASGNITEGTGRLLIADIPHELTFEYGVTNELIADTVLADTVFKKKFSIDNLTSEIGEHELEVRYGDFLYTVKISVKDTMPPELTVAEATVYKGAPVSPEAFVTSCTDAGIVSLSFDGVAPLTDSVGEQTVTVIAVDESGNRTQAETILRILDDTTPPVFYGVYNKTVVIGENISFKKGVSAVDREHGNVSFKVDASAVNTSAPGTYPVTYTATDYAGNTANITVYYTVAEVSHDLINSLADNILSQIVTYSMSPRQKAEAIYNWCTGTLSYSTKTSYLMGNYVDAAYSGFTTKSGNCYIYYAVSSSLLTRAGIENLMVERNIPSNPHVWSLVKIDGSWYHFDTCPHYSGHALRCFLLTDREVWEYSQNEVKNYYSFDSSRYPPTP